jgi:hypothetical protein
MNNISNISVDTYMHAYIHAYTYMHIHIYTQDCKFVKIDVDENKETAEACDVKVNTYLNLNPKPQTLNPATQSFSELLPKPKP